MPSFTPWQSLPAYGIGQPGSPIQGGMGGPQPFFRSAQDARLSMWNRTPEAMEPDGYLGTIRSRRDDRLLDHLKTRGNQRAYQRGVHKGERVGAESYSWPREFNPETGIKLEAMGKKFSPLGVAVIEPGPNQLAVAETDPGIGLRSRQLRALGTPWG